LDSRLIADPLRLLECPPLCDGAAAVVVTADPGPKETTVRVSGLGERHEASHLIGQHQVPLSQFPAVGDAADEAVADAGTAAGAIDVIEVYAPFPHVEAVAMEELDLCDRGEGAAVCLREEPSGEGPSPVSPSGGCLGRGHPAMVTPLLNYVEATRQLRGEAANQVADVRTALATSEHGHVDGATATILEAGR
jgi:acetyl-CoA acetyltransferase